MLAVSRAMFLGLLLPLAMSPAVAQEGPMQPFLLAPTQPAFVQPRPALKPTMTGAAIAVPLPPPAQLPPPPQPVAARDPRWSYTLQYFAKPAAAFVTTASLRDSRAKGAEPARESLNGPAHHLVGLASFYWQPQMTANGETFDPTQLTAAHKTLPFGTRVRVTDVRSGRSVIVRINDRGPFKPGRVIDLSQAAAQKIGMHTVGITPVKIEVVAR